MPPSWRAFRATVRVLGVVPLASGLAGVVLGSARVPGGPGGSVSASLESEYRFANVFWLAVAPAVWWSTASPRERAGPLRAVLGTVAVGGVARALAWRARGRPHPAFVSAMALELVGMPAVLAWHTRLLTRSPSAGDAPPPTTGLTGGLRAVRRAQSAARRASTSASSSASRSATRSRKSSTSPIS